MKHAALLMLIAMAAFGHCRAQSYTPIAYAIDTSATPHADGCLPLDSANSPFFQLRGKYPESSRRLAARAAAFLKEHGVLLSGSGYIRYGLQIDCTGLLLQIYRISQTDSSYRQAWFAKEPVEALALFIRTLNRWNDGTSKYYPRPVNYFTFLEFHIINGVITDVIP